MLDFQGIGKVTLLSKRKDVTHFVELACGGPGYVTVFDSFLKLSNTVAPLLLIDAGLLFSHDFDSFSALQKFRRITDDSICIITADCPRQIASFVEEKFKFILSFPMNLNLFRAHCLRYANIIRVNQTQNTLLFNAEASIPESLYGFFRGDSEMIKNVRRQLIRASDSDKPVLILGETGTGKSTSAGVIHMLSSRKNKDPVPMSISTISESLAESELFGHVKGAFTNAENDGKGYFEKADGTTLIIDELGLASLSIQGMLLSVLDTGTFHRVGDDKLHHTDFRLISATNADLQKMIHEGSFRDDLFHRINDQVIMIPPLRAHKEDIRGMVMNYFNDKSVIIREDAMATLESYNWPGNIRELHKCLDRAYENSSEGIITPEFIDFGGFNFPQ